MTKSTKTDQRKAVYVRLEPKEHQKLQKLVAARLRRGQPATKQGVIVELIKQASER